MPSDKEYKETRKIMEGEATIKQEFKGVAEWIDLAYSVRTVNIVYDTVRNGERPRLGVFLESERDKAEFLDKANMNLDVDKQKAIANKFKKHLKQQGLAKNKGLTSLFKKSTAQKYLLDNIWVYFSAFESVAKIEANESIPEEKIVQLKNDLKNSDLWEISRAFSSITFFLYTDILKRHYEDSKVRQKWADAYFDLLEPYNKFGYFKRDSFSINLDSKENFDNNYQSNWFYYYK
jgi:hypothetical protein